jgi:hypothetical protein
VNRDALVSVTERTYRIARARLLADIFKTRLSSVCEKTEELKLLIPTFMIIPQGGRHRTNAINENPVSMLQLSMRMAVLSCGHVGDVLNERRQ